MNEKVSGGPSEGSGETAVSEAEGDVQGSGEAGVDEDVPSASGTTADEDKTSQADSDMGGEGGVRETVPGGPSESSGETAVNEAEGGVQGGDEAGEMPPDAETGDDLEGTAPSSGNDESTGDAGDDDSGTESDDPDDDDGVSEAKGEEERNEQDDADDENQEEGEDSGQGVNGDAGAGGGVPLTPAAREELDKEYQAQQAAQDDADERFNQLGPDPGGRSPIDPVGSSAAESGEPIAQTTGDGGGPGAPSGVRSPTDGLVDSSEQPADSPDATLSFSGPQYVDPAAATGAGAEDVGATPIGLPRPADDAPEAEVVIDPGIGGQVGAMPLPPPDAAGGTGVLPVPPPSPAAQAGTDPDLAGQTGILPVPVPQTADDLEDDLVLADLSATSSIDEQLATNLVAYADVGDADLEVDGDDEIGVDV